MHANWLTEGNYCMKVNHLWCIKVKYILPPLISVDKTVVRGQVQAKKTLPIAVSTFFQGPLPETFGDFWRMVWEQRSATVVMMTKLEERSRVCNLLLSMVKAYP